MGKIESTQSSEQNAKEAAQIWQGLVKQGNHGVYKKDEELGEGSLQIGAASD